MTFKEKNVLAIIMGCIMYVLVHIIEGLMNQAFGMPLYTEPVDERLWIIMSALFGTMLIWLNTKDEYLED